MAMTTYLKNALLNRLFRSTAYEMPSVMYIALSKTAPTEAGGNCTEPSVEDYKRLEIASNEVNWSAADEGSINNATVFRFEETKESWTTAAAPITHWAIFDNSTNGNMLFFGSLTQAQEIPRGSILEIPENGLVTTIINQQ